MRRAPASQGKNSSNSSKVPQKNAQIVASGPGRSIGSGKRKTANDSSFEKPKKLMKHGADARLGPSASTFKAKLQSRHFEEKNPNPNPTTIKQEQEETVRDLLKYEPAEVEDQNIHKLIKPKKENPRLSQLKRTNSEENSPANRKCRSSVSMHSLDLISHSDELLKMEKESLETLIDLRNKEIQDLLAKIQEEKSKQKEIMGQVSKFQIPN